MQAQYFLARPGPQRNAVGASCRPQGPEREIRIGVGEVGHALLFDEEAVARQELHKALDDTKVAPAEPLRPPSLMVLRFTESYWH